jgi:propionyl-CoA carboxylase alpha chain
MECRINAEDPSRGFLPSTGRLVRCQPPPEEDGVRLDTGVIEGGEIPMYYDSMIAKLIVHGSDRSDAIAKMRHALNGYAIRGISSNIAFQAALLAHPKFVAGEFDTGFIAQQFPSGYSADAVAHEDPTFLRVLAAVANRVHTQRAMRLSGQLPGHEYRVGEEFVVVTTTAEGGLEQVPVTVRVEGKAFVVQAGGRGYRVEVHTPLRQVVVRGLCNGRPFCAQIERVGLAYRVVHDGTQIDAKVFTPRAAQLHALMPFKAPPDLSRYLLAPMPGLLVDVVVQPGQSVRAGERLAVIEAMKMENILVATQDAVVARVVADKGESLAVDQVILEFE